ncbi:RHS domain-containing protein, partial [Escherichia coli]
HYDSRHRLVHYTRTQYAEPLVESRYLYDPLGRRVAKRVWRRERDLTGWMSLSRKPEVTWYGWDGDRLTTIQNDRTRIQTVYQPGSFTPLIRVETATGELAKTQRRSLADALQQSGGEDGGRVVFPPVLVQMLDRLESEILTDRVSEESRRWLASCGLTVEQMQNQMDPVYTPARKIHLYHCDHRGLPLALVSTEGTTAWYAEYDEWGNLLNEENPHQLQQLIRLPGQQYDEESGLYYNRHRYYDPLQGRYITQDPIGLKGGWNFYQYPLNPISEIDPQGLNPLILSVVALMSCGLFSSGGVIQSGQQRRDQYGRKVNPEADKLTDEHKSGVNPGGNCSPQNLSDLQNEKNRLCNQSRACAPQMLRKEILRRYEINLACASVRKQINNQCFGGGDKAHMEEENKAYKTAADCSGLIK